jgi:hypothetical protein
MCARNVGDNKCKMNEEKQEEPYGSEESGHRRDDRRDAIEMGMAGGEHVGDFRHPPERDRLSQSPPLSQRE